MKLDEKTLALIAVGASVGANCQPCLASSITSALAGGADDREIAEAVGVGRKVRRGAASKMDDFAASLAGGGLQAAVAGGGCCGSEQVETGEEHGN